MALSAATRTTAVPGRPPLRVGAVSLVWRPRTVAVGVLALVAVVVAVVLNVSRGDFPLTPGEVVEVLVGGGDRGARFIVLDLRLPATLTGVLVGGALAVAGAITQTVSRNPLASPDVIGFTAGAGAAAVAVLVLGGGLGAFGAAGVTVGLPLAAFLGASVTAALIYGLAWRKGLQGYRLVLVGIAMQAMLVAVVQWLLIVAEVYEASQAYVWINGSLNARTWEHVVPVAVVLVVLVPVVLALSGTLGALQLGDDTARGLGLRVDRTRSVLVVVAVALVAAAVSAAGTIGFVALVAPQIAQRLVGAGRPPILCSLLVGSALVVGADVVARTVLPSPLPVGIVTAAVGAPYLLYLLVSQGREART